MAAEVPVPIVPVILSGGAGTRLWPVSREGHPKPFMKLPDGHTLLGRTVERAMAAGTAGRLMLVTNRDYYFVSKDEVGATLGADANKASYLLEPVGRNTAAAIAAAAHAITEEFGPQAVMLVLPADHLIEPVEDFVRATRDAAALAAQGKLVTFGIQPRSPETGYGYIEAGGAMRGGAAREVVRFVEKPDTETAKAYVASGNFLWNSGMFCMRASVLLEELALHRPQLAQAVAHCWKETGAQRGAPFTELASEPFSAVESISIDYAVMEPSKRLVVLPVHFGWNDIGSWSAIAGLVAPGADGNRVHGDAVVLDCEDCFISSEDRMVAAVGLRGVLVVDTPDALLVADAGSAQRVKDVVAHLKKRGHESYRLHRTVTRPWGTYTVLEGGPGYKIKRIDVRPGGALSLQMHRHRSEHWVVVSGTAKVQCDEREFLVLTNQSTYIPAGKKHRVENPGERDLVMIEVQSGDYLGEDDIVRFSDIYGRVTA
ncbi:mannose-1-phosphate guanylyltransferase/mannose-6-phosphate isomerase [Ramlibacter sp. PS4R-6]|uniref:mannose-1-phosphate guanylyltransferase/mannose-6-phosphate isomerase n=1 Tax=Ramlibacter sp. PS4R-6 TaxID=3133438 RepID=UPI0030A40C9B